MDTSSMLEPLQYFETVGRDKHHQNAVSFFDQLLQTSGVNVFENKDTVEAYRKQLEEAEQTNRKLKMLKLARLGLILGIIIGAICLIVGFAGGGGIGKRILLILVGMISIGASIMLLVTKVNPALKNSKSIHEKELQKAEELLQKAWAQMAPLNALFDDDDAKNILQKTIPEMKIDPHYTMERHQEFVNKYDYDPEQYEDEDQSTLDTLSGTLFGNPFVFERYLSHEIVKETYEGSLTIYWTETYEDSEGNIVREQRSQVLTATVEKPKPAYKRCTSLRYGHQGAPDLTFFRTFDHVERLTDKAVEKRVKSGEKALQKMARSSMKSGQQFTEMANSKFDVLFGATDRDNEVQFRMMFTPLAQVEMVKLLRSTTGYGDDFMFRKEKRTNFIVSEHSQNWDMDTSPDQFKSYDLEDTRNKFVTFNDRYYKSIYFDFAPLLAIPMYQQKPIKALETPDGAAPNYTVLEYEALANGLDRSLVAHPDTETGVIIKTAFKEKQGSVDLVTLTAYSYFTRERVDYVSVLGGDGNYHDVPVPWLEYIPLTHTTTMAVCSTNCSNHQFADHAVGQYGERITNIADRCNFEHGLFAYHCKPKENFESALSKISFLDTGVTGRK